MRAAPFPPAFLIVAAWALPAAPPRFTSSEALRAEWARQPLTLPATDVARLPAKDRAWFELALRRIGAPGAPALLPPELEKPSLEAWLAKAAAAQTPRERVTALHFLNRLKSPRALEALAGLSAKDAAAWPRHLHLEAQIAAARLNGAPVAQELQVFLDTRQKLGKVDPVRAQAARLRLVMAGVEKDLLPPVKATPGAILAVMDAWNRAPWEKRKELALGAFRTLDVDSPAWKALGLQRPEPGALDEACVGILARLAEGTPDPASEEILRIGGTPWACASSALAQWYQAQSLTRFATLPSPQREGLKALEALAGPHPSRIATFLPALRKFAPDVADRLRTAFLSGPDPLARAAAIGDLPEAPAELDALLPRLWKAEEYDGVQALLPLLEKWKLPAERRKALLERFYEHPCWTARLDAHTHLKKLDPAAPWPKAPEPTPEEAALLEEAARLAKSGKLVRMRITFSGRRQVTLRLDPRNAPMNVANLARLARKGFFNGRLVPRVVPDFVVQMGSPVDTMEGGPGYTVRCENSLEWYGPGSVGMALSGKDTGGSQFFITTNATPHLTGRYTRVGEVENPDRALPLLDALELGARIVRIDLLP